MRRKRRRVRPRYLRCGGRRLSNRCLSVGRGVWRADAVGSSFGGVVVEKREFFARMLGWDEEGGTPSQSGTW